MSHLPALAPNAGLTMLNDPATFDHIQRVAKMYASSELIPPHMRGKVADVCIAFTMAQEMGENPVVVMQNMYVVSGRAGWSSAYVIAKANRSGIFRGRINWRIKGAGKDLVVTCYAVLADTGEEVSYTVSMAMAEAEGWTKNPKYKTMPELMLRYRSGAALVRLYAWEVMLGYATFEENETLPPVRVVGPEADTPRPTAKAQLDKALGLDPDPVDYSEATRQPEREPIPVRAEEPAAAKVAEPPHFARFAAAVEADLDLNADAVVKWHLADHGTDPRTFGEPDLVALYNALMPGKDKRKAFEASPFYVEAK